MSIISFIGKLLGSAKQLSELEKIILNSVRKQLAEDVRFKWDSQVNAINKIQRLPGGVEVDFYHIKNGRPSFNEDLRFPNNVEELHLARVQIELPDFESKLVANVWCVRGFVFSIEYEESASYFEEAYGMESLPNFYVNTEMLADPASSLS